MFVSKVAKIIFGEWFIVAYFKYSNQNVYFNESGNGVPLLMLHGNTASSKMFEFVTELYNGFRLILLDFLGHGKSDRLAAFPTDIWFDEAMQVIRLIEHCGYDKVNIIGTSGGALVALNVALERGDLVNKVVADSFEGEKSMDLVTAYLSDDRRATKANENGRGFWEYCHGNDWESIVDNDTAAVTRHNDEIKGFFHRDLSQLNVPVLLTASVQDEFAAAAKLDFAQMYNSMAAKIKMCKLHLFESGGHPAMMSNAVEFADIAKAFLQ